MTPKQYVLSIYPDSVLMDYDKKIGPEIKVEVISFRKNITSYVIHSPYGKRISEFTSSPRMAWKNAEIRIKNAYSKYFP